MSSSEERLGIVVGVDDSDAANAAICWAARDAAMRDVPLTLMHTYNAFLPTFPAIPVAYEVELWQEKSGAQVLEHAAKIAKDSVEPGQEVAIALQLRNSHPVPALIALSDAAEMVVVGSHGHGAVARGLFGSVTSGLVRNARCPVAVIHDADPLIPHPFKARIVLGADGSPASEHATAIAFDEASRRGVVLRVVHAWSDIDVVDFAGMDWLSIEEEADYLVAERLAGWQERYPDVQVQRLIIPDRPARRIIKEAESAQLVVLGSRGRGGFSRLLLGSVSNAVVHSTNTPVIVVPPSKQH